jgi:hypothetical protein
MRRTIVSLALLAALGTAATATASAAERRAVSPADTDQFVYNQDGSLLGGLYAVSPDGRATVSISFPLSNGFSSHVIPASDLQVIDGRVVLTGMTEAQLQADTRALATR